MLFMALQPKYKTVATLATFAGRESNCYAAVESLLPQVDAVFVYRNSGTFEHAKVHLITGEDRGSNNKFFGIQFAEHAFICDDDIIYPPDYVAKTLSHPKSKTAIITYHGRVMPPRPAQSYRKGAKTVINFGNANKQTVVDILGNGVTSFPTSLFTPKWNEWPYSNMDDIFTSVDAYNQRIEIILPEKEAGWIIDNPSKGPKIGNNASAKDVLETYIWNYGYGSS
jgi:hypothetical protein